MSLHDLYGCLARELVACVISCHLSPFISFFTHTQCCFAMLFSPGFLAPHKIDPKLLNAQYVFKELDNDGHKTVDVLHKRAGIQKRHRDVRGLSAQLCEGC